MQDDDTIDTEDEDTTAESSTVSKKEMKKPLSKAAVVLIVITIILVVALFAFMLYMAIVNSAYAQQVGNREAEQRQGVKIDEKNNVKTDIKVGPSGEIINKDGEPVSAGSKITNDTNIVMSDDMKKAIEIEQSGSFNGKISVDGINVKGGVDVENGYATFYDNNDIKHTVPINNGTVIMCDGEPLSKNVINVMDNIGYGPDGEVIIDHMSVVSSYDSNSGNVTFSYNGPNGISYGSTCVENVSEKNGIYYSNGVKVDDIQQEYMTRFDRILDDKYPLTSNDNFFQEYKETAVNLNNNEYRDRSNDKNNLNASTNLEFRGNSIQF